MKETTWKAYAQMRDNVEMNITELELKSFDWINLA